MAILDELVTQIENPDLRADRRRGGEARKAEEIRLGV